MGVCNLYILVSEIALPEINALYYMMESLVFFTWAVALMVRYEPKTRHDVDYSNILLAFYRGDNSSLIMRFFNLFGVDVYSVAVVAGNKCLILKKDKEGFQFVDSEALLKKRANYVIVDTGEKVTPEFVNNMSKYAGKKAYKFKLRICCIQGISPLLTAIGQKYKPMSIFDNIPSVYLGKIDG